MCVVEGGGVGAKRGVLAQGKAPCKRKLERTFSAIPSSVCLCRTEVPNVTVY